MIKLKFVDCFLFFIYSINLAIIRLVSPLNFFDRLLIF